MKRTLFYTIGVFVASFCFATDEVEKTINNVERYCDSSWEHSKTQYSPPILGNGDIGLMLDYRNCQFQDIPSYKNIKCVTVKYRPSIYRAGRRTDDTRLVNFGRFEEQVNAQTSDDAKPDSWKQSLDIFGAVSRVENKYGKSQIDSEVFVHAKMPLVAISKKFSGEKLKSYTFEYIFSKIEKDNDTPLHTTLTEIDGGFSFKVEKSEIGGSFSKVGESIYGEVAVICDSPNAKFSRQQNKISVTIENPEGDVHFYIAYADSLKKNNFKKQMAEIKEKIGKESWGGLLQSHKDSWKDFWGKCYVSIPDKRLQATYYTSIYNLKCWSTDWSIPVGILPMHWEGKYFGFTFFNPALCASGHEREALKVAKFWRKNLNFARFRAGSQKKKNIDVGARYSWLTMEDGSEGTILGGRWLDHTLHMCNIPLESYTYFRYTNDKKYLKDVSYPVLKSSATFFQKQMVYKLADGRTIIGRCCDLERLPPSLENPMLTTTGAMFVLNAAAEAADILGVDADKAKEWREVSAELGKYLPRDNEKYLPYPNAGDVRSVGALCGVFPYGSVPTTDKLQVAAIYDFKKNGGAYGNMYTVGSRVCSWYAAWLGGALARLGDGDSANEAMVVSTESVGKFYEIFEINEPTVMSVPWCSSPQGTYIQVLNEMLLQCAGDTIKIVPAVSKEWKDYSFNLNAYDDISVEVKFADGKLSSVKLSAGENTSGREKQIVLPSGETKKIKLQKNQTITL